MSKLFKLTVIGIWFLSTGLSLGEKIIEAKVGAKSVETGEIFTYEIAVNGELDLSAQLQLPDFGGLSIVSESQYRDYSLDANTEKTTLTFIYYIFASEPGVYTIGPAILENDGIQYQSRSITIKAGGKPLEEKNRIQPYIEKGQSL